jgi:hypothetical protein
VTKHQRGAERLWFKGHLLWLKVVSYESGWSHPNFLSEIHVEAAASAGWKGRLKKLVMRWILLDRVDTGYPVVSGVFAIEMIKTKEIYTLTYELSLFSCHTRTQKDLSNIYPRPRFSVDCRPC